MKEFAQRHICNIYIRASFIVNMYLNYISQDKPRRPSQIQAYADYVPMYFSNRTIFCTFSKYSKLSLLNDLNVQLEQTYYANFQYFRNWRFDTFNIF